MPINRYEKAVEVLKPHKGSKIGLSELKKIIMINIGGDEVRTVVPYIKMMRETGLIKEVEHMKFYIL